MIDTHPYQCLDSEAFNNGPPRHYEIADSPRARRLALMMYELALAGAPLALIADIFERWARVLDDVAPADAEGREHLARGALLLRRVLDALSATDDARAELIAEAREIENSAAFRSRAGRIGALLAGYAWQLLTVPVPDTRARLAYMRWYDASELLHAVYSEADNDRQYIESLERADAAITRCAEVLHKRLLGRELAHA